MKDKLEQLVKDNKQAFDDKEPGDHVWAKISNQLQSTKPLQWIWKAAAIVFFITTVGLATQLVFVDGDKQSKEQALVTEDFKAVEDFYFKMISEKKSLIYDFEEQNVVVNQDFEQDMQKLDAMYLVLKEELKANPSKQVVDALVLNLLVRIDILNSQLQELDNTNTEEKPDDGQVNA